MSLRERWRAWHHARRGRAHFAQSRPAEAAAEYALAVALQPANIVAHINLGLALYHSGERQAARAAWQTALALAEQHDKPYLAEQARILLRQFG